MGGMVMWSIVPVEVWRPGSNVRSDSRSSPKNSARTGCCASGGHTSSTPPRTESSPWAVTSGMRSYPAAIRFSSNSANGLLSPPMDSRRVADATDAAAGTGSRRAANGATTASGYGRVM